MWTCLPTRADESDAHSIDSLDKRVINMKYLSILVMFIFSATLADHNDKSYDWSVVARVTIVEPTYLPRFSRLQVDEAAGDCEANSWLDYLGQGNTDELKFENAKEVHSNLLTALLSGKNVRLYGFNREHRSGNNPPCVVSFVHILKD